MYGYMTQCMTLQVNMGTSIVLLYPESAVLEHGPRKKHDNAEFKKNCNVVFSLNSNLRCITRNL